MVENMLEFMAGLADKVYSWYFHRNDEQQKAIRVYQRRLSRSCFWGKVLTVLTAYYLIAGLISLGPITLLMHLGRPTLLSAHLTSSSEAIELLAMTADLVYMLMLPIGLWMFFERIVWVSEKIFKVSSIIAGLVTSIGMIALIFPIMGWIFYFFVFLYTWFAAEALAIFLPFVIFFFAMPLWPLVWIWQKKCLQRDLDTLMNWTPENETQSENEVPEITENSECVLEKYSQAAGKS